MLDSFFQCVVVLLMFDSFSSSGFCSSGVLVLIHVLGTLFDVILIGTVIGLLVGSRFAALRVSSVWLVEVIV